MLCPFFVSLDLSSRVFGSRGFVSLGFVVLDLEILGLLLRGDGRPFPSISVPDSMWLPSMSGGPISGTCLGICGPVMTDVCTDPATCQLPMRAVLAASWNSELLELKPFL